MTFIRCPSERTLKTTLTRKNVVLLTTAGCMGLLSNPLPSVILYPGKAPSSRENWSVTDVQSLS